MKRLSLICLFSFFSLCLLAKNKRPHSGYLTPKELKEQLSKHDFSKLFTLTDNDAIYGFIGDNYQRIRIKLLVVTKDSLHPNIYHVYGKSMVKSNIDEFEGIITISNIVKLGYINYGVDDEYKNKGIKGEYTIKADYNFFENKNQPHSGTFKGICESDFYLDKNNKAHYDDLEFEADGYTNNEFIGQWFSYDGKISKRCNWGDFRIPDSGHFDIGAGEFSPHGYDNKYLKNGWQNMNDQKAEKAKWWE
jgi:hypothetical protein